MIKKTIKRELSEYILRRRNIMNRTDVCRLTRDKDVRCHAHQLLLTC
jgi:hypothetical protein